MRSKLGFGLVALAALLTAAPGTAVMCGEVITDAQTLTADLDCTTDTGVTIDDGGSLDMAGFTLSCDGTSFGVVLLGEKASLSNGFVTGCGSAGVSAGGAKHKIDHVLVSASGTGFSIGAPDTKISDCAALSNSNYGFYVAAPGSSLSRLLAKNNGNTGIVAGNGGHKIVDVSIVSSGAAGITLSGDGNKVSKARITGASYSLTSSGNFNKFSEVTSLKHGNHGFQIFGSYNQLKKCVASAAAGVTAGFAIDGGSDNSISGCRSTGSSTGIKVTGSSNMISKNRVFGSADKGISANGANNVIKGNLVVGSGNFDLFESFPGCPNGDVWEKNIGSRNDTCIE